jgi:ParB family chromosome partitioning protein
VPEPATKPAGLSQALADELAIQRRDILAVHVAADPELALDLAVFLMIDREAGYSSERSGSSLLALPPSDPVFGFKAPDAAATRAREEASESLDRSWTEPETRGGRFDVFRTLPEEAKAAWLGHAVARTLEASINLPGSRVCAFHDHLGGLLGIDVAKWWRPTGVNYFDRVPKSVTLAALEDVGGSAFASGYSKSKKAELSETAERIFAGSVSPVDAKERALAWVPDAMRFAPAAAPSAVDTPPWEDDPAEEPVGAEPEPRATNQPEPGDAPASGAPAESDSSPTAGGAQSGASAEDAPAAEQEEMKEAA